jgi:hypothetical protein
MPRLQLSCLPMSTQRSVAPFGTNRATSTCCDPCSAWPLLGGPGPRKVLRVAMTLAHNRGDLTQGMGFWKLTPVTATVMNHLSERGRFPLAVQLYQQTGLSAEGHRHYPLREGTASIAGHAVAAVSLSGQVGWRDRATEREPRSAGSARGRLLQDTGTARLLPRDRRYASCVPKRFRTRRQAYA